MADTADLKSASFGSTGSSPVPGTSFLHIAVSSAEQKADSCLGKLHFPALSFLFVLHRFFVMQKNGTAHYYRVALRFLPKISLRRRESRLAARALPSAVKSIFRRPRSSFLIGFALIVTASKAVFYMLRHVGLSPSVESRPGYQFFESVVDFFVPAADNGGGSYIGAARLPPAHQIKTLYQSVQSAANTTPATGRRYTDTMTCAKRSSF